MPNGRREHCTAAPPMMTRKASRRLVVPTIRRIVAMALAPAACTGGTGGPLGAGPFDASVQDEAEQGGDATASEGTDAGGAKGVDAAIPDALVADATGDGPGVPDDASCVPGPCALGCTVCDPSPYEDGGVGDCAPRWIAGDGCQGGQVLFPCGLPAVTGQPNSAYVLCATYCMGSPQFNGCELLIDGGVAGDPESFPLDASAGAVVRCYHDCTGRRPAALRNESSPPACSLGDVLARAAYLEAVSVHAFLELSEQLEAHGARPSLVRRVRRAARDEVRHAERMTGLARARGADVAVPSPVPHEPRSLLDIALLNATEGCVRETWGAACAVIQSVKAADLALRDTMRTIAEDELSHAQLSWDVACWLAERLAPAERAVVERARLEAIQRLESEASEAIPRAWGAALGWPSREQAAAVLRGMGERVWSVAA